MAKRSNKIVIPDEIITSKIYLSREKKVRLGKDLVELYNVFIFKNQKLCFL